MTEPLLIRDAAGTPTHAVLTIADFRRLIDAAEMAADVAAYDEAMAAIAAGEDEGVPAEVMRDIIAGANPVRTYRAWRGMKAGDLAEAAGINPSYLSQIENGHRPASLKALRALAAALRVDLEDLLPGEAGEDEDAGLAQGGRGKQTPA